MHYSSIQTHIQSKMLSGEGTWIDWQYLLVAADTLRKCRYTLKYTYPYAYYPKASVTPTTVISPLFEYQQGLLEAEVEDLSWKISHAEITGKGELLNKMAICEQHRRTLLQEFLWSYFPYLIFFHIRAHFFMLFSTAECCSFLYLGLKIGEMVYNLNCCGLLDEHNF